MDFLVSCEPISRATKHLINRFALYEHGFLKVELRPKFTTAIAEL
jgi:hypothetical protein